MKYFILLMLGTATLLSFQSTTNTATHPLFPLKDGAQYHYQYTFEDQEGTYSVEIRESKTKAGETVYYFAEVGDEPLIIGSASLGLGGYFVQENEVYTGDAFWLRELKDITPAQKQLFLPNPLNRQEAWTFQPEKGDPVRTLSYEGAETLSLPAGKLENCQKIKMLTAWKRGKTYEAYIWFKEGIGVVKWIRDTGRVEELTGYSIPD